LSKINHIYWAIRKCIDPSQNIEVINGYVYGMEDQSALILDKEARQAAVDGRLEWFEQLPEERLTALAHLKDEDQRSLFHISISSGNLDLSRLLLSSNPAVADQPDDSGWTPLMSACSCCHQEIVLYLIEFAKCDIFRTNPQGRTSLFYASSKDVNSHNPGGIVQILLDSARSSGDLATVARFISAQDCTKSTALHRACAVGNAAAVMHILQAVSTDTARSLAGMRDSGGETPVDIALEHGHNNCAQLIEEMTTG
jgi:ankyrin repeat protein